MIRKVKGGYQVVHCHGKDAGKPFSKKPMSKKRALAQHRAIEISKHARGDGTHVQRRWD